MESLIIKTMSKIAMLIEGVINANKVLIRAHKNLNGFIECVKFLRTIIDSDYY
jgi:hypothetical protein